MNASVCVYTGEELASYNFGAMHPFGPKRHDAFVTEFKKRGLDQRVRHGVPKNTSRAELELFHTKNYIDQVQTQSLSGNGYLDCGDTPAFVGVYEAACWVVGTTLDAMTKIMMGECQHAFVPIAGLHHARRESAAGFCVFNDCGIAIEKLKRDYGLTRIAYVDIDAHHGDGVYYGFENDPAVIFVDLHEDGRFLYPGTGRVDEIGTGPGRGLKLNIPMPSHANDQMATAEWARAELFLENHKPEFIILQCGADSLAGDPITHLEYTEKFHGMVAKSLCLLAQKLGHHRVLALGGGGYNLTNIGDAWSTVVENLF